MAGDWARLEDLFEKASGRTVTEREAFLRDACPDDPELRRKVGALAAVGPEAEAFFDSLGAALASWAVADVSDMESAGAARAGEGSPDDPLVGVEVGRYRIELRLGAGGMGLVYKAHDPSLDRPVAVKVLPPHLRDHHGARERFLVEARAAAALEHPNVCTVHEVGESSEVGPFLAMTLYEGETLKERIARGPLSVLEAVDVAAQVARGLAAAHEGGVVHRDVKPGNVMLTPDGTAKILDFGLARLGDLHLTEPGVRPGTIAYMSPEQIRGDDADSRSDLWSLGVLLYEMLAGERPFRGPDAAVLHAVVHADPPPLRERRHDVPEALDTVVARLLSKDPDDRFQSAGDLPEVLVTAAEGPVTPYVRAGAGARSVPAWAAAHPVRASALGFVALLAAGAAAYGLVSTVDDPPAGPSAVAQQMSLRGYEYLNRPGDADTRKFPPAMSFFHRALEADPEYAPAYVGLSESFRRNDSQPQAIRRDSALHYAARAVEVAPERADALAVLGLAYAFADEREPAEEQYRRAIQLDPDQADALSGLALLAALDGRLDDAVRWERRAVAADPASARRLFNLGSYLFDLGDLDGAAAAFRRAIEFSPDLPDAAYLLAHVHRIRGEEAEAEARLAEMNAAASDHPGTRGLAVRFHAAQGRFERAAAEMDEALIPPPVYQAYIAKRLGQEERAAAYLAEVEEVLAQWTGDGFAIPRLEKHVAALRDDVDGVLAVLEAHWRSGLRQARPGPPWIGVYWADHDPILDQVRDDPRFLDLLTSIREELDAMRAALVSEDAG